MPDSPETGTVTSLEPQENDSSRVSVFVDGEFVLGAHEDVIVKHGVRVGTTLSPEDQRQIEQDDQYVQAKQQALSYLAHKPRTETEVRRKLRRNDTPDVVIEDVVARLYELEYLDDESYAQDYARNRFASKQYGPLRIRRELTERGIDRAIAERAVDDLFAEENPLAAARHHAEKRWPRLADEEPRRRKQKMYRYLRRRGFSSDTIYTVLDELQADRPR